MNILRKYNSLSETKKAAFWFLLANFFTKGISFITVPFFTNWLNTEEFGKYNVFLTYQSVLIIFATLEMYSGAYTRGILKYKDDVNFFTWSEQMLSILLTFLIFVICIPLMPWLIAKSQIDFKIYIIMFGYFLVFPAFQCWINLKRFEYDYRPVVVGTIIYSVLSTLIPLYAVMNFHSTASVRIWYMLLMQFLVCIPFFFRNFHLFKLLSDIKKMLEQWKFLLRFQAPLAVHAMSYVILATLDRLMIEEMTGSSEVGVYSLASTISSVIMIICISANQVLKPWRYKKMEKCEYRTIKDISSKILIVFGVAILFWVLIAPDIIHLFFKSEYYDSVWAIPPLSISVFFVFLYSMFVDVEEFFYKTEYVLYATTLSAVVNILLNYYGINYFGYLVCSYTTLISYALLAFLHLSFSDKACWYNGVRINQIFSIKNICYCSIIIVVFGIAITLSYGFDIIRYTLMSIILVIGVLNVKKIGSVLSALIKGDV